MYFHVSCKVTNVATDLAWLYTVSGSPVRTPTLSARPDQVEHRATHERILETLTTPGRVESGNEKPVDLLEN